MNRETQADSQDTGGQDGNAGATRPVRVWDLATRLFHWVLVALIGLSWYSGETGDMDLHIRSGMAILTLVIFRVIWGFAGSATSRFSGFLRSPHAAMKYGLDLARNRAPRFLGHNPLGGWMVVVLLLSLAVQAGAGLFANDDIFTEGPLAHLVTKDTSDFLTVVHKTSFNVLLALAAIHIAAALFYWLGKGENLILPMITGKKQLDSRDGTPDPRLRNPIAAAAALGAAAFVVWVVVTQI